MSMSRLIRRLTRVLTSNGIAHLPWNPGSLGSKRRMRYQQLLRFAILVVALMPALLSGQESKSTKDVAEQLEVAKEKLAPATEYLLRYKFEPDEIIRWRVTHLGSTETTIQGNTQGSKSRSVSTKLWRVTQVDDEGNITFTHSVDHVEMWQKLSDRPEVNYDSEKDAEAPPEYEQVAKTLGVVLATVTVAPDGQIIKRDGDTPLLNLGLGDIIMLLPPKAVKAGSRWHEPSELQARDASGQVKRIKTRKSYTLEKVQAGVATISVKTEVLTPINDARLQSQIVQQLTNGTIKFDVDAGRLISKQMDWDETVIGFNGADSQLKYLARITEELLPTVPTSTRAAAQDADAD